ncbi:calcium-binding protein [Streptomyces sp. WI04-05B]|uniref:calcium-binding protein n=1 Tax=Streptomyces TaxID=1883 RepID=UPI0029BCEB55|nr:MULTISPECIES: calcium-binding protein [unclassified Streptomyces]MDX2543082.1 calcium-binding protein [Streptomyces sp. WI04-05B]MDX2584877.1 calcium-binding protein [Streptomyces sp. WI04-05A]MDX3752031.1 calcium-binding protein [Streptomyces sp. AK08-02]
MPFSPTRRRTTRTASASALALTLALGTGLATVPLLLAAGTAGAATPSAKAEVSFNDREFTYTAAAGQTNKVTVTESYANATDITFVVDDVVPISVGRGCVYPSATDHTKVACTVVTVDSQSPYQIMRMNLGDGNDVVDFTNESDETYLTTAFVLGAGKDKLTGRGNVAGNFVLGEAGDDTISAGNALLVAGGDGNDTITTSGDIAQGGKGNDVIRGGAGAQDLSGDDGNDTVYGGADGDHMYGGKGNDVLYGNAGIDYIWGNSGNDKLYGGAGQDILSGGAGTNVVRQD